MGQVNEEGFAGDIVVGRAEMGFCLVGIRAGRGGAGAGGRIFVAKMFVVFHERTIGSRAWPCHGVFYPIGVRPGFEMAG